MSNRIRFTKMHGIGNDFVVLDGINQAIELTPERVRKLADRHFGVGCDQVLVVLPPQTPSCDFRYQIFNEDGNEVENCGNGVRCFAKFVRDKQLTGKTAITVETLGGNLIIHANSDGHYTVDMGVPVLEPVQIPFIADVRAVNYSLPLQDQVLDISAVSMGNPHAVTLVEDVATAPVETLGPLIESHELFPNNVNAGFMTICSRNEINLRVFERGVGETLACGTGACAAVVAGHLRQLLDDEVVVHLPGGDLKIQWQGEGHPVLMTGPATTVYHGQVKL